MNIDELVDRLNVVASRSFAREPFKTTEELRNFLDNQQRRTPFVRDEVISKIIDTYRTTDDPGRTLIISKLTQPALALLLQYAAEAAARAVRDGSPEKIVAGLVALAIEGGRRDIRDSIVNLARLYHSALRLRMDAEATFSDTATLAGTPELQRAMEGFPKRPVRDLKAFGLREVMTEDGFDYDFGF